MWTEAISGAELLSLTEGVVEYLQRSGVPVEDARDFVQEAMVRALERPDIRSPRAWLRTVARRMAVTSRMRRRKHVGVDPFLLSDGEPPSAELERREFESAAFAALSTLPEPLGLIFEGRVNGLSLAATADLLGISKRTVQRKCAEARALLRAALRDYL